jgi:hypothetical protein
MNVSQFRHKSAAFERGNYSQAVRFEIADWPIGIPGDIGATLSRGKDQHRLQREDLIRLAVQFLREKLRPGARPRAEIKSE